MQKKILIWLLLCGLMYGAKAQNSITEYEYWFDKNVNSKTIVPTSHGNVSLTLDIVSLSEGVHVYNFRAKDTKGNWSAPLTQYFYRTSTNTTLNQLVKYEYWIDKDYTAKQVVSTSNGLVNLNLDVTVLRKGIHYINFRAQDAKRNWSAPVTQYFYCPEPSRSKNQLVKYEYWIDKDYAAKQVIETSNSMINLNLDVAALRKGIHYINFRTQDTKGYWSAPVTQYFYCPETVVADNKIVAYEYWFNDSINHRTHVDIDPANPFILQNALLPVNNLITKISKSNFQLQKEETGDYQFALNNKFYIRFKDANGKWSTPTDTTFVAVMDASEIDLTPFILNSIANDRNNNWTITGSGMSSTPPQTEHWTGLPNPYFHGTCNNTTVTMRQTITGLPAGTYILKAAGRSTANAQLTLSVNQDSIDFTSLGNVGGEIWDDAPVDSDIKNVNAGKGYGWSWQTLVFTVDDNPFTIAVNARGIGSGQWFSIDDFNLSMNSVATLSVTMPKNANPDEYKGLSLDLTNKANSAVVGVSTTEDTSYTFNGLKTNNLYSLVLKTNRGVVLAAIDSIKLKNGLNTVIFDSLSRRVTASLQVFTADNKDITEQVTIHWYNAEGKHFASGSKLTEAATGNTVAYDILLNTNLGTQWIEPQRQSYTLKNEANSIVCTLQPIQSVTVSGIVKGENNLSLSGVSVSIQQILNGKYPKNSSALADKDGKFTVNPLNDSTTLVFAAPGYISKTMSYRNFAATTVLGTIVLEEIKGLTITTRLIYVKSVAQGETPVKDSLYFGNQNIDYEIYNQTKGQNIRDFYVQMPYLITPNKVNAHDILLITAKSRTGEFVSAQCTTKVAEDNAATAYLELVELGGLKAAYTGSNQGNYTGMLYNAQGQLTGQKDYNNASLAFNHLADGNYTLVSMLHSDYFNSVLSFQSLEASGLKQGVDFVVNPVTVKSGIISTINIASIPVLNESKLYYTGANTSFTVNKTSVMAGNYVTLRAMVDFKPEYKSSVKNISLLVDIPEGCSFIENSVMAGSAIAAYVKEGNRIVIPWSDYTQAIKFCITPNQGGNYAPNALVKFEYMQNTKTQPIGSASFAATDMSIVVPSVTAKKQITVSGTAPAHSTVNVMDGNVQIAQTRALANGNWMMACELDKPYNLSTHPISAKILTQSGNTIQTETKRVLYDISSIEVSKVTVINNNTNIAFDFLNPKQTMPHYSFNPNYPDFTFKISFTKNDTTVISNVVLYVRTSANKVVAVPAIYDEKANLWIATEKFTSNNLPVNVSVDYVANTEPIIDRDFYTDKRNEIYEPFTNYQLTLSQLDSISNFIDNELIDENPNYAYIDSILNTLNLIITDSTVFSSIDNYLSNLSEGQLSQYIDNLLNETDSILSRIDNGLNQFSNDIENYSGYGTSIIELVDGKTGTLVTNTCDGINEANLIQEGFTLIPTTTGRYIYVKYSDFEFVIIDFERNIYQQLFVNQSYLKMGSAYNLEGTVPYLKMIMQKLLLHKNTIQIIWENLRIDLFAQKELLVLKKIDIDVSIRKIDGAIDNATGFHKLELQVQKANLVRSSKEIDIKYVKVANELEINMGAVTKIVGAVSSLVTEIYKEINELNLINTLNVPGCAFVNGKLAAEADALQVQIDNLRWNTGVYYGGCIARSTAYLLLDGVLAPTLLPAIALGAVQIWAEIQLSQKHHWIVESQMDIIRIQCNTLEIKCIIRDEDKDKPIEYSDNTNNNGINTNNRRNGYSGSGNITGIIDPSGYVYEAVSSNRLEGVRATIYYKTTEEDMYGDNQEVVIKWDAEDYSQINPLITDENGLYAWDVPQGLWQVKFEKAGYETTYSEWLPVPPPQLDVNIGMERLTYPVVKKVRGYEEGINIHFDKYMKPATLNAEHIVITHKGLPVAGTIKMLNEEDSYLSDTISFASKMRFIPSKAFATGDMVTLTVKKEVESYAGMLMEQDYIGTFKIEKEVKSIIADSSLEIKLHKDGMLHVKALPAEAAKGKKLIARVASSSIASISNNEIVLNAKGEASFTITGDLLGGTAVRFVVDDMDDLEATTAIRVYKPQADTIVSKDSVTITATASPTAGGTITGAGKYEVNTTVQLQATVNSGYQFRYWQESGDSVYNLQNYSFTATTNRSLVAIFDSITTSINDFVTQTSILKVYPNPVVNGKLKIEIGELGQKAQGNGQISKSSNSQINIYDMQGKLVAVYSLSFGEVGEASIDISQLPSGVYIVKVGEESVKVVKNE